MVTATIWSVSQICFPGETRCTHQDDDSEINNDIAVLSLPETAQNNNMKVNSDKIQFKTVDFNFWTASHPRWHEYRFKES